MAQFTSQDETDAGKLVWDLLDLRRKYQAQGVDLVDVLNWAARGMAGVYAYPDAQPETAALPLDGEAQTAETEANQALADLATIGSGSGNDTVTGGGA